MIKIIIDPEYADDPKLIDQKAKLEKAFEDWPCPQGSMGFIQLSNNPNNKSFRNCVGSGKTTEEFINHMNKALYPHLAK